jgi:predicted Zn-dependent peptidase
MRTIDITRSPRLGEEVHSTRLANGLTVSVLPKRGFLKKYAVLATRYGSIDNVFQAAGESEAREVPAGIAHFLEHKLFEEEGGNAFDRFSKNGAYCNAFTSYTTTAYLFSCTDLFAENLGLLVDFVGNPYFTEAAIARERQIISQEIRMYEDSPDWRGFQGLLEALYVRHPVRVDITGTVESISRIEKADLERCYRTFYQPRNMILFAAGDLDPAEVMDRADEAFARRRYGEAGEPRRVVVDEPGALAAREVRLELDVSQPRLLLGWKDVTGAGSGAELLRKDVELAFAIELIFGRSGAFYQRCYESGLIDAGFSASYTGERDHGYVAVGGETDEPDRLRDELCAAAARAVEAGFDEADFRRIKNKAIGKFLRNFNSLEFIASSFVQGHFLDVDFFEYLPAIDAATREDVQARAAEVFRKDRMASSIVEPLEERAPAAEPARAGAP